MNFKKLFKVTKPIIGMVHVDALPGTPNYKGEVNNIIKNAIERSKNISGCRNKFDCS